MLLFIENQVDGELIVRYCREGGMILFIQYHDLRDIIQV